MTTSETPFRDRSVTVLGAASDMGVAVARAFGQAGAQVWLADVDERRLEAHGEALRAEGLEIEARRVDVTNAAAVDDFVRAADAARTGLEASIQLAGVITDVDTLDMTEAQLDHVLSVNL
ncbi:MAG: SDR family NAD(P)-dependent oxidoreductase, partial [Actinomycetota bacterium]|nr:SDR family NAD(P)-dependent oxidoreductase [Actinomycetota bacterium]